MGRRNNRKIFEDLEVIDAGAKGKAIAKAPDGKVVFINNAVPGDIVTVQTTKKKRAYYEGTAISFSNYSQKRTTPVCEHFGVCGGCKWQHMGYEHQLFYKQKEVENNLKRLGGVKLPDIAPILGSKDTYFYRNKMEYTFSGSPWYIEDESYDDIIIGLHVPKRFDKILDCSGNLCPALHCRMVLNISLMIQ